MRIEELMLTAFGRFQGRRVELGPGLNIIHGPNEAGKSTVQRFILGMLYGFKRRGQRREFTPDAERFRPWAGADYRGALVYRLEDGRAYRVERQFDRDLARIFDAATGEELTARFPTDRRKELLFAEEHWKLGEDAFRSTAWVGQLEVGRLEAGQELVARVANLQESGREDLSVKAALAALDDQAREIGTERAPTRPYGRVCRQIEEKRRELERAETARGQVRGWEARLAEVRAVLAGLDEDLLQLQRRRAGALLAGAQARLDRLAERVQELQARRAAVAAEADRYPGMAEAAPAVERELLGAEDGVRRQERLGMLELEAERLSQAIKTMEVMMEPLEPVARQGEATLAQVERLEAQMAALRGAAEDAGLEQLRDRVTELERVHRPAAGLLWVLLAGLFFGIVGFVQAVGLPPGMGPELLLPVTVGAGALGVVSLVFFVMARVKAGRRGREIEGLHRQLDQQDGALVRGRAEMQRLERARAAALAAIGVTSAAEVRSRIIRYEQMVTRRDGLHQQLDLVTTELAHLQTDETRRSQRLRALIARALGRTDAQLAEFEEAHARWQGLQRQLAQLDQELRELALLEQSERGAAGEARAEAAEILAAAGISEGIAATDVGIDSPQALAAEARRVEARRGELNATASDLAARIETALGDLPDTADLRRELEALLEEKAGYDEELAAIELARTTITAVGAEMHREFAPRLNRAMGAIIAELTDRRYSRVQLDETTAIRVVTEGDRTVDLLSLSGGTVDQFYLGLRLALLDLLTEGQEPVPLMMDDPFVQYDDDRVRAGLITLADAARDRQVLLMTCHRREVALAREIAPDAHIIQL